MWLISICDIVAYLCKILKRQNLTDAAYGSGCACLGDTLTYKCTVVGGVSTVWTGTAFHCATWNNEIVLLHSRFNYQYRTRNNGSILARGISTEGNNYTSQLNVTVTPDTAGKTVMCLGDNGRESTIHLSLTIPTTGLSPSIEYR